MAIPADQYITQAILDDTRYVQGGRRVVQASNQMHDATDKVGRRARSLDADFQKVWQLGEVGLRAGTAFAGALGMIGGAIGALSIYSLKAYGDMESLERAVMAVDGSAAAAKKRLEELKEIAKAPGLGFQEGIEAYVRLRGSGASGDLSKTMISEFANANALVGGGRESFDRILLALSQILSKNNLEGQDVRQLAESRIPIYDILRRRFGTSDTEDINRAGVGSKEAVSVILEELKQLPRVTGGFKNSVENLTDAANRGAASIGEGMVFAVEGMSSKLSDAIEKLTDAGVFKNLGEKLGQDFEMLMQNITGNGTVEGALIDFGGYVVMASAGLRNFILNLKSIADILDFLSPAKMIMGGISDKSLSPGAERDRFLAEAAKYQELAARRKQNRTNSAGEEVVAEPELPKPIEAENNKYLRIIADATERMASVFDGSTAFGGGDAIRKGISIVDVTKSNGGRGRSSNMRTDLVNAIESMIDAKIAALG